jgi:serine protease Do
LTKPFAGFFLLASRSVSPPSCLMFRGHCVSGPLARVFIFLTAFLFIVGGAAKPADTPTALRSQVDAAIARVRPALVRIRVVSTEYAEGREIKQQSVGSGAIITKDGYIVTNHHVAGHAARMFCTLWNREEIEAELIGTDAMTDISVIKLKPDSPRDFEPVGFGDSGKMRVGDQVLAMGSPMALSQSVTLGIISNIEMIMPRFFGRGGQFRLDGEDVGSLVKWIGHDAPIYGGNSGGPLVNLKGEIIGINEISFGLGGAIPGNLAQQVVETLKAKGKVERSWIGVDVQPLFKRAKNKRGVLISGVMAESPAAAAGMKSGDLLLSVAGKPTDVRFDEQLPDFIRITTSLPIGKKVDAVILRDGKEIKVQIEAAERGELFPKQKELKQWGITARNISPLMRREMKRDSMEGVLVGTVRPGGPAGEAKPALEYRDVILDIGGTPVKSLAGLIAATEKLTADKTEPTPVIVTFERKAERFLTVVKVGIKDLKDPGLEVTKAWLPVEMHVISRDIARELGQPDLKGFYITRVYTNSPTDKAGLKAGDFITALDGEKLSASAQEHQDELTTLIRQYDVGKTVELTILRDKVEKKISVELARSPRLQREMKKYRNDDFEFTARDVSFFDAADQQWRENQRGALVEDVKPGSWAELGSLNVGDLILEVDGQSVENLESLREQMETVGKGKKPTVTMKVLRGIHTAFLELEPAWKN